MKHNRSVRQFSRLVLRLFLLGLIFLSTTASSSFPQTTHWWGKLYLDLTRDPNAQNVCVGDSVPLDFLVLNNVDIPDVPPPVNWAMVEVKDDQGNVRAQVTNAAGNSTVYWPVTKAGYISLTAQATKTDYTASQPIRLALDATECRWYLKIEFQEEYPIIPEWNMVVGATTEWYGQLKVDKPHADSTSTKVELLGGSGEFNSYAADQIPAPFHFTLTDPISGDFPLQVEGYLSDGQLKLNMGVNPLQYAKLVHLELKDYSEYNIQVKYVPVLPTAEGNGMFLELNHLDNVTLPAEGGSIHLDHGMSCYFNLGDHSLYSLTITLMPIRGNQY